MVKCYNPFANCNFPINPAGKMAKKSFIIIPVVVILLSSGRCSFQVLASSAPAVPDHQVIYPRECQAKPRIDGDLDDEAWQAPPLKKDYISFSPGYGELIPEKTWAWMAYDKENLYFAFQCWDSNSKGIKTSLSKRDQMFDDDWISVSLDTMRNKQTMYSFFVNPNGIQGDALVSPIKGEDRAPDFVWESAGKITPQGYQVEISIPLRSLRFKSGEKVKMGVLLKRKLYRLGIIAAWPEIKPGQGPLNSHIPIVYKNLVSPLKLEILPSFTWNSNQERVNPEPWGEKEQLSNLGIGVKYGITSAITAEVTINPDFSQVESDTFQVEINQRYPLFYSEKRPFFMEGADIFDFYTAFEGFLSNPVHTRQIVDPLWGMKVTGSVGKTLLGILAALDKGPDQKSFFGIARMRYSLDKDNYIGILYSGHELSGDYNRVAGADFVYRLFKDHKVSASFLYSMSAPQANQDNQVNSLDLNLAYSYDTRHLRFVGEMEHIGKDFRMDSSFLKRTGINYDSLWSSYYFYPNSRKIPWLKIIQLEFAVDYFHDLYTHRDDLFFNLGAITKFSREGYLGFNYYPGKESWQGKKFNVNQSELIGGMQIFKWLSIEGVLTWGNWIYYDAEPSYTGKGISASLSLVLQPNKNLNQQFSFFHSDLHKDRLTLYDVNILYSRTTYQFNKYFFLRAVLQYNSYAKRLLTDFLASFALIPGTVLHIGYGGLYENNKGQENQWSSHRGNLFNTRRSFLLKASYLWRL